jgi:hypothetical protein
MMPPAVVIVHLQQECCYARYCACCCAACSSGVRIGANYAGEVRVYGCAFAGPEEEAVHKEFAGGVR